MPLNLWQKQVIFGTRGVTRLPRHAAAFLCNKEELGAIPQNELPKRIGHFKCDLSQCHPDCFFVRDLFCRGEPLKH